MQNTNGACLAMTVAALFAAACEQNAPSAKGTAEATTSPPVVMPVPGAGEVQCLGIHECKGKSACHVIGSHACAGQNTCKGKGWISVLPAECKAKGGKILES
jgi:hypothetical protein